MPSGTPRIGRPALPAATNGNGNGHGPKPRGGRPKGRRTFSSVVSTIGKKGEPAGYRQMRDILFLRYDDFKVQGESLGTVLKLAIEASKHALMVELHEKKKSGGDADKYDEFQAYLRGETNVPPSPSGPPVTLGNDRAGAAVDHDETGEGDGEEA